MNNAANTEAEPMTLGSKHRDRFLYMKLADVWDEGYASGYHDASGCQCDQGDEPVETQMSSPENPYRIYLDTRLT